jgi:hypothetical protein
MKRIENKDLPDQIFRVIKVNRDRIDEESEEEDDLSKNKTDPAENNGYFKILRLGNFKKI